MHWAKFKPRVRYDLTGSEVAHFRMDSLPITISDLGLDGASHPRYTPLREAIAERYQVTSDQVVAADGTSMANFLAMATLISPGDEVLVEHPTYEPLLSAASFLGARIKRFVRDPDKGFSLDPTSVERQISPSTRLLVITNLHNPSCSLASDEQLQEIGAIAARHHAFVLVDEVYLDTARSAGSSAVHLGSNFVCTNSLTKAYGLSGLRCGWILAEPQTAESMWRLNDLFGVNQAHPAERLAELAFAHIDEISGSNWAVLAENRALWNRFASARTDLDCPPANHGVTAFPRWTGGDTRRLDEELRSRHDTAVVPGHWFEMEDHFRIGFALPRTDFEEALLRLEAGLEKLR